MRYLTIFFLAVSVTTSGAFVSTVWAKSGEPCMQTGYDDYGNKYEYDKCEYDEGNRRGIQKLKEASDWISRKQQ